MKKQLTVIAILIVALLTAGIIAGCGTNKSKHLHGYAVVQKVTMNSPSGAGFSVQLAMNNSTNRSVETADYTVTLPNNQGTVTLLKNESTQGTIPYYYYGATGHATNVTNHLDFGKNISPYIYSASPDPGQEAGVYTFNNVPHTHMAITSNTAYPDFLDVVAPLDDSFIQPGNPIPVSWLTLGPSYSYLVVAYTQDGEGNIVKMWSNYDIRDLDFRSASSVNTFFSNLQTTTQTEIPADIFAAGEQVLVTVSGFDKDHFSSDSTGRYGYMMMAVSEALVRVNIGLIPTQE